MEPTPDRWASLGGRGALAPPPGAGDFDTGAAPPLPLDQWVLRHRRVVGGPRPGPWRHANAPFAVEPMAAFSDRSVESVAVVSPAQLMKSEFAVNAVVWTAATGRDVLFYEPDVPLLKKFLADRIRPAFLQLGYHVPRIDAQGLKGKDSTFEIRLPGSGTITGLTPAMRSGKAAHTAPVIVIDELDQMASPDMYLVAQARSSSYEGDAAILAVSVPSEDVAGSIWRQWLDGSRGTWKAPCPHCGELVGVGWDRVQFEKDDEGYWLPRWGPGEHEVAALVCEACGARWTEGERRAAVGKGCYVHQFPERARRSFHVPGPAHLWRTIEGIVEKGADAWRAAVDEHDWSVYRRFINEWAGLPWADDYRGLSARRLADSAFSLGARGANDLGELDPRVVLLTAFADVGAHAIHAEWVGWGLDDRNRVMSWGLQYRVFGGEAADTIEEPELWDQFHRAIERSVWRHPHAAGAVVGAQKVLVDSRYEHAIVREHLARWARDEAVARKLPRMEFFAPRVLPWMSKASETGEHPVNLRIGVSTPEKRRQVPAVVWGEPGPLKDAIYDSLMLDRRLPHGAEPANRWPADGPSRGFTPAYFKELSSEVRSEERTRAGRMVRRWDLRKGAAGRNEAWDCRVGARAAALVLVWPRSLVDGISALSNAPPPPPPPKGNVVRFPARGG